MSALKAAAFAFAAPSLAFAGTIAPDNTVAFQASTPFEPRPPAQGDLPSICTDRPTKSNVACSVEPGHVQYEVDVLDETSLRQNGITTKTMMVGNPTLKYGISPGVDIEVDLAPHEIVEIHSQSGEITKLSGVGDLYIRVKDNAFNTFDGKLSVAVIPLIKAPTARIGIGNGAVEGGVLVPIDYKLTDKITLATVPEVDVFKDLVGPGRHVNTAQLVNIGYSLSNAITLYAELWADWNFDPIQSTRQYSADFAVAWSVTKYLQLDAGLNIGLNRATPGAQTYVGVSKKF